MRMQDTLEEFIGCHIYVDNMGVVRGGVLGYKYGFYLQLEGGRYYFQPHIMNGFVVEDVDYEIFLYTKDKNIEREIAAINYNEFLKQQEKEKEEEVNLGEI